LTNRCRSTCWRNNSRLFHQETANFRWAERAHSMGRVIALKCFRQYNTIIRRHKTSKLAREEHSGTSLRNSLNDLAQLWCVLLNILKSLIIHNPLLIIIRLQDEHGFMYFIWGSEPAHSHIWCPEEPLVVARSLQLTMDFLHAFLE
jgi:hypothetical protein